MLDPLPLPALPVLRGEHVILRESRESDIDDRLRHPIDPGEEDGYGSAWRRGWDGRRYHTREYLAAARRPPERGAYTWAVEYDRHCIGSAGLRVDADQHRASYTVGLFAAAARGRGLGREVTRLVVAWGLAGLGLHRIELEVVAGNTRAIHCYLACGFRREGARREAELYPDGWRDLILMGLLRSEIHKNLPNGPGSTPWLTAASPVRAEPYGLAARRVRSVAVEGTTFLAVLRQLAGTDPGRPALTCEDQTLTRAEFTHRVERLAALFAERGVRQGSTVTIALPNSIGFVESMFAAWALGAVPQPVSDRLPPAERAAIVDLADPALVVGAPESGGPQSDGPQSDRGARPTLESVPGQLPAGPFTPGVSPEWKLMTSGGSTGRPKLIAATQPALFETVGAAAGLVRVRPGGCVLITGPLAHNAPFVVATVGMLLGNHVVLMPRFDAAQTLRLVERHRVSWLLLVPTMMLRIWRLPEPVRLAADVSSLEVAFHLAAPCPAWLKQAWIDWLGPRTVVELYGGTELQAVTVISGSEWLAHRGSVGRTVLGEIEIRDPDGRPVPVGEEGEIWMRRGRTPSSRTGTSAPEPAARPTAGSRSVTSARSTRTGTYTSPTGSRT